MNLFVYGSLRVGNGPHTWTGLKDHGTFKGTFRLTGFDMYDFFAFPGAVEGAGSILCELYKVKNKRTLDHIDTYEGFRPDAPTDSLFVRKLVSQNNIPLGYIYLFNKSLADQKLIPNGDWNEHAKKHRESQQAPRIVA